MDRDDWINFTMMILWGVFGFWTGSAYERGDEVGFYFGLLLTFGFPIGFAVKRLASEWSRRREWERRYGKPYSESERAKRQRRDP